MTHHQPVMLNEVTRYIVMPHYKVYVDMTVGSGGHASAILRAASPDAMLIGMDRDETALSLAAKGLKLDFEGRFRLFWGCF